MKKKMERLSEKRLRSSTPDEQARTFDGGTRTANASFDTANPNPDFQRDGDNE